MKQVKVMKRIELQVSDSVYMTLSKGQVYSVLDDNDVVYALQVGHGFIVVPKNYRLVEL